MKLRYLGYLLVVMLGSLVGCGGEAGAGAGADSAELSGHLTITGSSTLAPLVSEIAQRFETQHPNVRIDVQTGGSSRGIIDVQRGTAEIGMASRQLLDNERASLNNHLVARDGIGLIVHTDNPIDKLSDDQLRGIFTGRVDRWAEIDGMDQPLTVVNKAEGRATLAVFLDYYELSSEDIEADVVIGDNQHGIKTVAGDPGAIGYVSIGAAKVEIDRGVPIRVLPVGGAAGTLSNLRQGLYPLIRPLILVTLQDTSPLIDTFIEYARSEAVHDLIEAFSYVPAD